jgi:nucleoside-diphosphate-sugar epimerase
VTILITGGGGFLGNQLAREILARAILRPSGGNSASLEKIVLADIGFGKAVEEGLGPRAIFATGDLGDRSFADSLLSHHPDVIFHLAAMVSGDGERDFAGCWRSNTEGTRNLLEACREVCPMTVVVFASSLAVFGGSDMPAVVTDRTKPFPRTTYGMTKLIGELMINEYTRKGYVDGRAARLPTIFIRPGKPNAAASSFASGMFREPLNGQPFALPVPIDQGVPLLGYRRAVQNLVHLSEVPASAIGDDRVMTMPSNRYRVSDMIAALTEVAKRRGIALGPITLSPDETIIGIVRGWPEGTQADRARSLGMKADESVQQVIDDYITDFL